MTNMNTALQTTNTETDLVPSDVDAGALALALSGDLGKLTNDQKLKFFGALCKYTGLNPLARPFEWIVFQGKVVLYANKGCAEQLRKIHKVNIEIKSRETIDGILVVRVAATDRDGRMDEAIGAVAVKGLVGDALANAFMKAETKAKRRVTLSICGLGMLDESELETIPGARVVTDGDPISQVETAQDVADKFNKQLTGGEKAKAVEVDQVVVANTAKDATSNVHILDVSQGINQSVEDMFKPEPEPATTGTPAKDTIQADSFLPVISLEEQALRELETVLSEHPKSVSYLVAHNHLKSGDGLDKLDPVFAAKVLKYSKRFLESVETWDKSNKKT